MGDLISRLQGDRVTLWRPDVKKQHRTRAPLDQAVLSEAPEQRRRAGAKRHGPGSGAPAVLWLRSANSAQSNKDSCGAGGWRWLREPILLTGHPWVHLWGQSPLRPGAGRALAVALSAPAPSVHPSPVSLVIPTRSANPPSHRRSLSCG